MTADTQTYNNNAIVLDSILLDAKWEELLQRIEPVYGNPDAARIADIMHAQMRGEDTTERKRQMLADKALAEETNVDTDGEEEEPSDWETRRTRYLESLPKNVLIDFLNMSNEEREMLIEDNMDIIGGLELWIK